MNPNEQQHDDLEIAATKLAELFVLTIDEKHKKRKRKTADTKPQED